MSVHLRRLGLVAGVLGCVGAAGVVHFTASRPEQHADADAGAKRDGARPDAASLRPPADVAAPPSDLRPASSGVASRVLEAGRGTEHPRDDDRVTIHYTSWRRDGRLADSSRLRDEPVVHSVRRLIPGLGEAVRSMVVGESRRVWVPRELAFASDDEHPAPNEDLTIDVELVDLKKAPDPVPLTIPPPSATSTSSGLAYEIVRRAEGKRSPEAASRVTFYHSGWTSQGVLFESSTMAGRAEERLVSELLPGLAQGIRLMKEGDKARFWVPSGLAYGDHPRRGAPAGALTFELELVAVE